jgi:hypothetical protein
MLFCFPNGDVSDISLEICRAFHDGAVSTVQGWNHSDTDPHLLQRISLHEGNSSTKGRLLAAITPWIG